VSANLNVSNPSRPKRVLMIAANPAVSPVTQWPVGFWWAELTHPYWAFTEAGYAVEIRSPDGGALVADSYSDPEDSSGYSWAGIANSEEAIAGTNFVVDQRFREFAVRDGRLITGQQQFSGAAAARLVIETLGR
jgi:putative intracellular protease/amidase